VRHATLVFAFIALAACSDVREFRGTWQGPRVGDDPVLRVGIAVNATATLEIDQIDTHGFSGSLAVDGLMGPTQIQSLPSAEADVLAQTTWSGSPLRVYLGFVPVDAGGDALALVALYDGRRIEVRVLRGGTSPLYGIFSLIEAP
jgi:hypothetical protein